MPKAMCFAGIILGILAVFVFGFDLALGFPFQKASITMDIGFIIAGLLLAYLGWTAKAELG